MIYTLHICRLKELDRIYIYRVVVGGCTKTTPIIDVKIVNEGHESSITIVM